jgi:hypothetical protein
MLPGILGRRALPVGRRPRVGHAGRGLWRASAASDADLTGAGVRVRYSVAVTDRSGPLRVEAELLYQPVGYRWAVNLGAFDAIETNRFVKIFESTVSASVSRLARAATVTR